MKTALKWTQGTLTIHSGTTWLTLSDGGRLILRRRGARALRELRQQLEELERIRVYQTGSTVTLSGEQGPIDCEWQQLRLRLSEGDKRHALDWAIFTDLLRWLSYASGEEELCGGSNGLRSITLTRQQDRIAIAGGLGRDKIHVTPGDARRLQKALLDAGDGGGDQALTGCDWQANINNKERGFDFFTRHLPGGATCFLVHLERSCLPRLAEKLERALKGVL